MSMSLTISQPAKTEFGGRATHDFSPRISLAKSRLSPKLRVDSPLSSLPASASADFKMTTPHRGLDRGLPLPSASTLPDPGRPPPSLSQTLGAMPNPPVQWQGQEDSMRNWLVAKAEEDKRKQEEEKTRQEMYRLEQRKIERDMLHDSLQAGVPPSLVPLIYAGIGGLNLGHPQLEFIQRELQAVSQQYQQQSPPELRRDARLIGQAPSQYGAPQPQQHQVVPSQPTEQPQQSGPSQTIFSAYQPAPSRPPPTSAPRSASHSSLPRLTTNEMFVTQPPQQGPSSAHPLQQSQTIQPEQPTSSPSIYFHHWVPPNESKSNQPQTPASKGEPHSAHPSGSHMSESDYKESPRKRKAQGPHQPAPPPSTGPQYTSPPFSTTSSTSGRGKSGHTRSRSNTDSRPESRRDPDPPRSSQPESGEHSDERRPRESSSSLAHEESTGRSSTEAQRDAYREERPDSRGSR